jgi:uncharacterized protein
LQCGIGISSDINVGWEDMKVTTNKTRASQLARFILVAVALMVPTLTLLPLGGWFLWQQGYLLWWALAALIWASCVTIALRFILKSPTESELSSDTVAGQTGSLPDENWSSLEQLAWADVQRLAGSTSLENLTDPQTFLDLGLTTIETVAKRLHPEKSDALWRFTLPEALTISERVSRQLAQSVVSHVPFGDSMTLAQFWTIYRWRRSIDVAERAYDIWRVLRFANPATAMTHEARDRLSRAVVQWGREHVSRRIAETFVEEVGRAGIDLYGGRLKRFAPSANAPMKDPPVAGIDVILDVETKAAPAAERRSRLHTPKQVASAAVALGRSVFRRRRRS